MPLVPDVSLMTVVEAPQISISPTRQSTGVLTLGFSISGLPFATGTSTT